MHRSSTSNKKFPLRKNDLTCLRAAIFFGLHLPKELHCQRLTMTPLLRLLVAILSVATLFVAVEAGSNEASKAWLAENAKKDGVHVLPSGLQYRVLRKVRPHAFAMFVLMRSYYHVLVYTFVISHEYLPFTCTCTCTYSTHSIRDPEPITRRLIAPALAITRAP